MDEHEANNAEYRQCLANAAPLQVAWSQAEQAWFKDRDNPDLYAAVVAAEEAVRFNRACLVAAGEAVKDVKF